MSSDEPILELDDVEVHFTPQGGGVFSDLFASETVRAVDGVNLDVYENDVVALVGESGCGKTTLGKTAIGLERPTSGSVRYRGQDIWQARDAEGDIQIPYREIRRSLQIVHQDPASALNPNKTVEHSLSKPMQIWEPELSYADREARIYGMLERCGITPAEDYAQRFPHQLSGGEKQRVALVRALLMNPDVILADEAVSALDVSLRVEMMDLMLELQEEFNTSYILISHNLSNARYMAEQADGEIGIMYLGDMVEIGPADEVLHGTNHPYTEALRWATPDIAQPEEEIGEPPLRSIDIPDPVNPPSGCKFHTRCPEAREVCTEMTPELHATEEGSARASCFRVYGDDHEYWDSEPIEEEGDSILGVGESGAEEESSAD